MGKNKRRYGPKKPYMGPKKELRTQMKEERKTDTMKIAAIKWLENALASGEDINPHKSGQKKHVYRPQAYKIYKQYGTIEAVKKYLMGEGSIKKRETLKEAFLENKLGQAQARYERVTDASAWLRDQIAICAPLVAPSSNTENFRMRGYLVRMYLEKGWPGVLVWERNQMLNDEKKRVNIQKFVKEQDEVLGEMRKLQGDGAGPSGEQDEDVDDDDGDDDGEDNCRHSDVFDSDEEMLVPDDDYNDAGIPDQSKTGVPFPTDLRTPYKPDEGAIRYTGIVKWFNAKKGFGFICRNDNNQDVFVHQSSIIKKNPRHYHRSLDDNEEVEFEIKPDEKGVDVAINVTGPRGYEVKGSRYAIPDRKYAKRERMGQFYRLDEKGESLETPGLGNWVTQPIGKTLEKEKGSISNGDIVKKPIGNILKDFQDAYTKDYIRSPKTSSNEGVQAPALEGLINQKHSVEDFVIEELHGR